MKKIKCVKTGGIEELTLNEIYEVVSESEYWYTIVNNSEVQEGYQKHLFKEVKELNIIEASNMYLGTEFKIIYQDGFKDDYTCKVVKSGRGNMLAWTHNEESIGGTQNLINAKFIPIQKSVNFMTAWKSIEEGKTIESTYTLDRYKIIDGLIKIQHQGGEFEKCGNIATTEIGNEWIIID